MNVTTLRKYISERNLESHPRLTENDGRLEIEVSMYMGREGCSGFVNSVRSLISLSRILSNGV